MTINLDDLRKTAEAPGVRPGPWHVYDRGIGYEVHDENDYELTGGMRETFDKADAEFIATFDPPTVLALLSRLEQAELELVAVKSTQVQHIVTTSFETARAAGIALDEAVKLVAGWLVDDPDKRAREAEAKVARVRELNQFLPASIMERITRALDSDGRG